MDRPTTKRVLAAKAVMDAAWEALAPAAASNDQAALERARASYQESVKAYEEAVKDATRRSKTSRGTFRRDANFTPEQESARANVLSRLGVGPADVETPSVDELKKFSLPIKRSTEAMLAAWSSACGTLGNATVARWLIVAGLERLGSPPGWQGPWPPVLDNEEEQEREHDDGT